MNLNSMVAGIINTVKPLEEVAIFRCTGQINNKGIMVPTYTPSPTVAMSDIQSVGDAALKQMNRIGMNDKTLHFYLDGDWRGIFRPDGTGGDMIYARGNWWQVIAVPEDFSVAGWVCVRGSLQMTGPEGIIYP